MRHPKRVLLGTLEVGAKFSVPDWPPCPGWPELLVGWDGELLALSSGRARVRRTRRATELWVEGELVATKVEELDVTLGLEVEVANAAKA